MMILYIYSNNNKHHHHHHQHHYALPGVLVENCPPTNGTSSGFLDYIDIHNIHIYTYIYYIINHIYIYIYSVYTYINENVLEHGF